MSIRKIKKEEIKSFLNPSIKNILPNPYILKDMDTAIERIEKAIIDKEKIGIFGDYDVDGATSAAMISSYLEYCEIHIPDRKSEGFGPNEKAFLKFINLGVNLIFTVDCGTLSFTPIDFAKKRNIDRVVKYQGLFITTNISFGSSVQIPTLLEPNQNLITYVLQVCVFYF